MIVRLEASVATECAVAFQKKALKIVSLNFSKPLDPNLSEVPVFWKIVKNPNKAHSYSGSPEFPW